jgi:hypothetical protein
MNFPNPARREKLLALAAVAALVWLNAYLIRQVFGIEHTGKMHSMHGFWTALARWGPGDWLKPSWWPFWYNGMPFEFTYAPGLPGSAALLAKLTGCSPSRGVHMMIGVAFCLPPAALFVLAWQVYRRVGLAFVAGAVYSLTSLSELILPDMGFDLRRVAGARRMYVNFTWDEAPHHLALAMACLGIAVLVHSLRERRPASLFLSSLLMAASMLANPFGGTTLGLLLLCLLFAFDTQSWRRNAAAIATAGLLAYLVVSPFYPPGLIQAIRTNAALFPDSAWSVRSWYGLAIASAGFLLLWRLTKRIRYWHLRFLSLFAWSMWCIPALHYWYDIHFLLQPGRYKVELEAGLALLLTAIAGKAAGRLPTEVQAVVCLALLWCAYTVTLDQRRYSKREIREVDSRLSIERRSADWMEANLAGKRVFAGGTAGQWMNAYSGVHQFGGGSYPTAPNATLTRALYFVYSSGQVESTILWLKAFGVDAVLMPGEKSPEFWKPFRPYGKFDGALPVLWREQDTAIYAVPRRRTSLAQVVPASRLVKSVAEDPADVSPIRGFVQALEDEQAPGAAFTWESAGRARIRTVAPPESVVVVHMNGFSGWKAESGGRSLTVERDGLGQLVLRPGCHGECEITLEYDGGWEGRWTRLAASAALLALLAGMTGRLRLRYAS